MNEMNLQKYIGKIFIHTKKAIRKGHPNNRLYYVTKIETDSDGDPVQFLCAWKITKITEKIWDHPAFRTKNNPFTCVEFLRAGNLCGDKSKNLSTPTATFIPDSFYKEVTFEQAIKELKSKGG